MILDELVLQDVGVYAGEHRIALTPPSANKPIILIGGMNGGGKTTILDSIQLALFGRRSAPATAHDGRYDDYLLSSINRLANPWGGASVDISFRVRRDGREQPVRVRRSWRKTGTGASETLEVYVNDELDEVLTSQWLEHVDEMLPTEVAPLFFFDGERIEQLADLEKSAQVLSTAVHSLLGLDIVDRLVTDLVVLERRHRKRGRSKKEIGRVEELEQGFEKVQRAYSAAVLDCASQRNGLDAAEKELKKARRAFEKAGGRLYESRKESEVRQRELQQRIKELDEQLRDLAGGSAPLLLIPSSLEAIRARCRLEARYASSQLMQSALAARDAHVLEQLASLKASKRFLGQLKSTLDADREGRTENPPEGPRLALSEESARRLEHHLETGLGSLSQEIRALLARRSGFSEELDRVEQALASIPDEESVAKVAQRLREAEVLVETEQIKMDAANSEKDRLSREVEVCRTKLSRELERLGLDTLTQEDSARIVHHAGRVRDTMADFRKLVVERHVGRIEDLVLDSFRQLLRKKSLVHHLEIDPSTYAIAIRDAANDEIRAERLSAGERQLLAVSLLWGLARAAGRPLPFVVDTPLGRLDSSHRSSLVKRYFPNASHQTIVLSTDEEIDETYYPQLRKHVGREYLLEFDDASRSTTVREGYFFS